MVDTPESDFRGLRKEQRTTGVDGIIECGGGSCRAIVTKGCLSSECLRDQVDQVMARIFRASVGMAISRPNSPAMRTIFSIN